MWACSHRVTLPFALPKWYKVFWYYTFKQTRSKYQNHDWLGPTGKFVCVPEHNTLFKETPTYTIWFHRCSIQLREVDFFTQHLFCSNWISIWRNWTLKETLSAEFEISTKRVTAVALSTHCQTSWCTHLLSGPDLTAAAACRHSVTHHLNIRPWPWLTDAEVGGKKASDKLEHDHSSFEGSWTGTHRAH